MSELNLKPIHLCFLDFETTGLDKERHDIIDVAAVRVTGDPGPDWESTWRETVVIDSKVKPAHPYVEPFVARLNGYSPKAWEDARSLPDVLVELYDAINNSIICGSNPQFDYDFVKSGFEALGWNFPRMLSHHKIDVPMLGIKMLLEGKVEKIRQNVLAQHFGLGEQEHRAMTDVRQCMEIFRKFLAPQL